MSYLRRVPHRGMIQQNRLLYFELLLVQVAYTLWSALGRFASQRPEIVGTKCEHAQTPTQWTVDLFTFFSYSYAWWTNVSIDFKNGYIYLSIWIANSTHIPFQYTASWKVGDFQCVRDIFRIIWFRSNGASAICFRMCISVVSKQRRTFETDWFLEPCSNHVYRGWTWCGKRTLYIADWIFSKIK